jgi:hypothetical protein
MHPMKNILNIIFSLAFLLGCTKQNAPLANADTSSTDGAVSNTIQFSGYTWNVKQGNRLGPGPNAWRRKNVWVDSSGYLHLKISYDSASGKWSCAEVSTQEKFGFGKWQFWVEGRIDKMDKNVVLGLFNYSGNDGFDEMDIEWARWGNKNYPNCNYTVWPAQTGYKNFSYTKELALPGRKTTQRFTRTDSSVYFQSLKGFTGIDKNEMASATCTSPPHSISSLAMPAYINLWLFKGLPPSNGKEVEIIIHKFTFKAG